jgi:hypothetical protein
VDPDGGTGDHDAAIVNAVIKSAIASGRPTESDFDVPCAARQPVTRAQAYAARYEELGLRVEEWLRFAR